MRLWHKDLIEVLPDKQLLGQWRELSAIAGSINKHGTPGHLLVDKIMDYPSTHFKYYVRLVQREMVNRGFKISQETIDKIAFIDWDNKTIFNKAVTDRNLFGAWHDYRYLVQCLYNLQEKYDCGGISRYDWDIIQEHFEGDLL